MSFFVAHACPRNRLYISPKTLRTPDQNEHKEGRAFSFALLGMPITKLDVVFILVTTDNVHIYSCIYFTLKLKYKTYNNLHHMCKCI